MLIDSHCHIPHEKYQQSPEQIVSEALQGGVEKLVTIGTSLKDSQGVLEVARKFENVYAVVGIYPHEDLGLDLPRLEEGLKALISESAGKVVGIGECGLDRPENQTDYPVRSLEEQLELFKMQLGLAVQTGLPVVLHNRGADPEFIDILGKYKNTGLTGVAHCYSSDWEFAKKLLHLNFYVSFSGLVTYPTTSPSILEAAKNIPRDRLMVETDSPYMPPQGHRGEVNYPKYVKITAERIAEIRNTRPEEIEKYTYENTCRLFKI